MRRAPALFTIILSVALVATGCGGGKKQAKGHKARVAASASQVDPTTSIADNSAAPSGAPRDAKSASKHAATTTTTAYAYKNVVAMPKDFTVTVDKACIHPEETQGFTVHGGTPGQPLIYDTAYSNGTDDYTSHYGTGSGQDKFGAQGTYRATFVLAGNVPPGTAYLSVASTRGELIQARTTFLIKKLGEKC